MHRQAADGSSAPTLASMPPHNAWNMDLAPDDITTVYNAIYSGTAWEQVIDKYPA